MKSGFLLNVSCADQVGRGEQQREQHGEGHLQQENPPQYHLLEAGYHSGPSETLGD